MWTAVKLACIGFLATSACVIIGIAPYPAAAAMAATGVAAVGVNRSITGDCWGACVGRTTCERDSGLCVPRACGDECRIDEVCENDKCILRRREQPSFAATPDASPPPEDGDGGQPY